LKTKKPWKLLLRTSALATGIALVAILILLIGGKPLISLIFGKQFLGAYSALMVLMAVPLLGVLSFPMAPMLYALDRPDAPLTARIAGTLGYFAIVAPLCWRFGLVGAAIAYAIGNAVTVLFLVLQLRGEHRRVRA